MKNRLILPRALALVFAISLLPSASGCAAHRSTTVTTSETDSEPRARLSDDTEISRSESKTVTKEDTSSEHHGVFQILGDIISLPFRAVGALFTAIF